MGEWNAPPRLEDLTANERDQFEKAIIEGDSGTREWETLMMMVTVNSWGNGDAYVRRQAMRALYAAEMERRAS